MPAANDSRRTVLTSVALALAGCVGGEPTATQSDSPTDVHTMSVTRTGSSSATPKGTLRIDPIPARDADADLTVYPTDLQEWIRTATTSDQPLRTHAQTPTYDPAPPLTAFERVVVTDDTRGKTGTYDLRIEGGTRYELLVGVEETEPPESATVRQVTELPQERREVALAAIGAVSDADARVYPETTLGSWIRTRFFGGYFAHDGTVYRGKELQQTDVEFFSRAVWYVITATAVDASSAPVVLRLTSIPEPVRTAVESLRTDADRPQAAETVVTGDTAATVEAFVATNPLILTHDAIYRLTFEP